MGVGKNLLFGRNKLVDDTGFCRNVCTHHRFQPNHLHNINLVGILVHVQYHIEKCLVIIFLSINR